MKLSKLLLFVFLNIFFIGCQSTNTTTDSLTQTCYISLDGLWHCTPETAMKFKHGTLNSVIRIMTNNDHELTAKGYFLWNDQYNDNWELIDIQFNDSLKEITIIDADKDKYIGQIDDKMQMINGIVYSGDPNNSVPLDTLNFVRADESLAARLFFPREPNIDGSIQYAYFKPKQMDDNLESASIFEFTQDSSAIFNLMGKIIGQDYGRLESVLIAKDGKLLLEEYFYSYDRTQLHPIYSCTKSVTSLLLGIFLERHPDFNIDQPVFDFFPEYDSLKTPENEQITLRHLLTMTAGLEWNEFPKEMYETDDWLHYILSRKCETKPGERFSYNSGYSILLGAIINSFEDMPTEVFAKKYLFDPLGISEFHWETHPKGLAQCGGGLHLLPRDMLKLGLLVLNNGAWKNKQIVPKEWLYESTSPQVVESEFFNYGFHWWCRSQENKDWWKNNHNAENKHDIVVALGHGGQFIIINHKLNMVIVTTASDYGDDQKVLTKVPMAIEEIYPLFINENAPKS